VDFKKYNEILQRLELRRWVIQKLKI
jgi:hypothetical protein